MWPLKVPLGLKISLGKKHIGPSPPARSTNAPLPCLQPFVRHSMQVPACMSCGNTDKARLALLLVIARTP